jgi:hypothetical protein
MSRVRRPAAVVLAAAFGLTAGALTACAGHAKPTIGAPADPATTVVDDTAVTEPVTAPVSTIASLTGGDGARFCAAFDQTFPVLFVIGLAQADGNDQVALAEVAMAPVLDGPLSALLAAAPSELAPPYAAWKARNDQALAAFRAIGVGNQALNRYTGDVQGVLAKVEDGSGDGGGLDDPAGYASERGIDRDKLTAAAAAFGKANGTFDNLDAQLDSPLEATADIRQQITDNYPCLTDFLDEGEG